MKDEEKTKEQLIEELAALRQSLSNLEKLAAQQQAQRERLVSDIAQRIRQSLNLEEVLCTTVSEVRQFLGAERVFIYRFQADWSGVVIVESVDSSCTSILGKKITDSFFADPVERDHYQQGRTQAIADIYTAGLSPCHIDLLAQLQIRANLVVPILQGENLWGLLVANYCSTVRQWQQWEIDLLEQLATHLAIALQQSQLYEQTQRLLQKEQALNRVIQSIRNSLDLETIFSTAVREIAQLLEADRAHLVQYLPERQLWLNVADYRQTPELPSALGLEIPDINNEIAQRLKRLEVVEIEDPNTCCDPINRNFAQIYCGAWLLVPLYFGSSVWGSLGLVRNKQLLAWQEEEVKLTQAIADQLAIAIQQSTLFQQLQTELKERQQIEAVLQQKQHFIHRVLETAPDIIYVYDLVQQRNIYVNHQIWEILGYTSLQIQSMQEAVLPSLIHPDDMPRVGEHLKSFPSLKEGEVIEIEYRMRHANGEWRWLNSRETVFAKNAEDMAVQILGAASDITERKNFIAALQESEERFRTMADTAPLFIWTADTDKLCNFANKTWLNFSGRRQEDELGEGWSELVHPDDLQFCLDTYTTAFDARQSYTIEYRCKRFDGEYRWILDTGNPRFNSDGSFAGYIGSCTDITDQKQALQAVQDSEARLNLALEAASMGIWDWNILNNSIFWSQQMGPIFGLAPGSTYPTYEAFLNSVHPEDRDRVATTVRNAVEQRTDYQVEFRVVWPDGTAHWIGNKGQVFYNQTGKAIRMLGVAMDITERKQAEEKIREQAALLNITTDAIVIRDLENQIIFWNKSAERIYGWKAQEALGKNINQLLYKQTLPQQQQALHQAKLTGEWHGELHQVTKDGKEIIIESRWTLVRDQQGNPKSILTVNTDITQKKLLEAQFFRAQRLESLGTLASGIAHDLNNILTPMLMSAQLLQKKISDEQNQLLLQTLTTNTQRGAALVKQVLSFVRGVEGRHTILQLRHLIWEIKQFAKQTFPKYIEIRTDIAPNLWAISGDATQLHQVLINLVINACDAMPKGGILSIAAENFYVDETYAQMNLNAFVGAHVVITVKDTGIGMPPEILDRIFEPFFTTKEIGKGTGLGLSTVLGIIKSHGGFINVSSSVGQGTKFQVFLKAVQESVILPAEDLELPAGNGELILVVDDETEVREITKTTLLRYNYKVLTASDGIEAITLYAQNRDEISVVLMDMMMPGMDGLTTIRTLQKINPQVKVIPSSGLLESKQLVQVSDIKTFLLKPYTIRQLLQSLHSIIFEVQR